MRIVSSAPQSHWKLICSPQPDLNAALSDQQEALRYIKANAQRLGGDPEKVVLGGQSAGASKAVIGSEGLLNDDKVGLVGFKLLSREEL